MRRLITSLSLTALALGTLSTVSMPEASAGPEWDSNKWAVIIGIDHHYGKTRTNVGSAGDATDLYHLLVDRLGWPASQVKLLTNKSATQAAIREHMQWLVDNSNEKSYSVFHYSGHIKQVTDKKDRDKDGEVTDEFLWPADNKFISDNELGGYMRALRGWAWVDISGCEAAGLNDGIASTRRLYTASSQEHEKSYEDKSWANSVFSGLMIDYGMLRGQGDLSGNGSVTLHEAFKYAAEHAPHITKNQKNGPQHPYIAGGDGTEWLLNPPKPPPTPSTSPPRKCLVDPVLCL